MKFKTIQNGFFLALIILTTLAFFGLLKGFLIPLFWAVVLAVLFHPMQNRWLKVVRERQSLAALLTLLSIIAIVIIPLFFVGLAVANESVALYERIESGEINIGEKIQSIQNSLPAVPPFLVRRGFDAEKIKEMLSNGAVTVSQFLAARALAFGQSALQFIVLLFLVLYILFFFLRDGKRMIEGIVRAIPLGDARERVLFTKFAEVSRATLKGTIVVGGVQGAIGAVLFFALGITGPVFWGVIMTLLSLLPAIGPALVWVPTAIILMVTGHMVKGLIVIAVGTFIIGLVDNILRPILVGRDTKMPDFLILLSTLGGLGVFGLSGFVIGPIIASFFLAVWDMFVEEFGAEDDHAAVVAAPPASQVPAE